MAQDGDRAIDDGAFTHLDDAFDGAIPYDASQPGAPQEKNEGGGASSHVFVKTKARMPRSSQAIFISRQVKLMNEGLSKRVTIIHAPEGHGKTTLLSSFCKMNARRYTTVWLTLDDRDADPSQFLFSVMSAFEYSDASLRFAEAQDDLLDKGSGNEEREALPQRFALLINALVDSKKEYLLVLDEYHLAASDEVLGLTRRFIDMMPETVHVMISSMMRPRLPIAAWDLNDELVELGVSDLRLAEDEADYFLSIAAKDEMSSDDKHLLYSLSDGRFSLLSRLMKDDIFKPGIAHDREAQERALHFVDDMNAYEFNRLFDAKSGSVIAKMALLPRFNKELLVEVGGADMADHVLDELKDEGVLENMLQGTSEWFKFKAEATRVLSRVIPRLTDKEERQQVREIAYAYYERWGYINDAVELALKSNDALHFVSILTHHYGHVLKEAEGRSVIAWVDQMKITAESGGIAYMLVNAWANMVSGRPRAAKLWIDLINDEPFDEHSGNDSPQLAMQEHNPEIRHMHLLVSTISACISSQLSKYHEGLERTQRVLSEIEVDPAAIRSEMWLWITLQHNLGETYMHLGMIEQAHAALDRCMSHCIFGGRPVLYFMCVYEIGRIKLSAGDLGAAWRIGREGLRIEAEADYQRLWSVGLVHLLGGYINLYRGDIEKARSFYESAKMRLMRDTNLDGYLESMVLRGRIEMVAGSAKKAVAIMANAYNEAMLTDVPRGVREDVIMNYVLSLTNSGEYVKAKTLLKKHEDRFPRYDTERYICFMMHMASIRASQGAYDEALALERDLEELADDADLGFYSAYADMCKADVLWKMGNEEDALEALVTSLAKNIVDGICIIYLYRNNAIGEMFSRLLANDMPIQSTYDDMRSEILDFARKVYHLRKSLVAERVDETGAIDKLTSKEREVNDLVKRGLSRKEIARLLDISQNTLKTHIRNINRKTGNQHG